MSNEQLYLVIGIPILFNLLGFLITNMRINDNNQKLRDLDTRLTNQIRDLDVRLTNLIDKLDKRIDRLDEDLRDWAKIVMQHNTDVARLKDKTGLDK